MKNIVTKDSLCTILAINNNILVVLIHTNIDIIRIQKYFKHYHHVNFVIMKSLYYYYYYELITSHNPDTPSQGVGVDEGKIIKNN